VSNNDIMGSESDLRPKTAGNPKFTSEIKLNNDSKIPSS
jgi:hypothetical protein